VTSGAPTHMAAWLESAWLARYLERQLDGEELAWFEAYLLDKPELLGMVEADNALRDGLARRGEFLAESKLADKEHFTRSERVNWFGAAASLLIGVGIGSATVHLMGEEHISANPPRIVFDTERGIDTMPIVRHADSAAPYLVVEVAVPANAEDIQLVAEGAPDIGISADADGFVSLLVPRKASGTPTYVRFTLSGRSHVIKVLPLSAKEKL